MGFAAVVPQHALALVACCVSGDQPASGVDQLGRIELGIFWTGENGFQGVLFSDAGNHEPDLLS